MPLGHISYTEWSDDIDLFIEGLSNPDKLEGLWEQSKAKKLWDESQSRFPSRLDKHLATTHPPDDSVPVEDYMGRWCNTIYRTSSGSQDPPSPTPALHQRMPPLYSTEELKNLERYNGFMNDLSVRVEGGWSPLDSLPYDEDLLRHTLGLSPRIGLNCDFYPDSDRNQGVPTLREGTPKRLQISENSASNSEKKTESDQNSRIFSPLKRPLCGSKRENSLQDRQLSEDVELPFQQDVPLQEEDDDQKTHFPDREIFMSIISEIQEYNDDPMERVDLVDYNSSDYDKFLSDTKATKTEAVDYEIPPPPPGVTVTVHLDDEKNKLKKIQNQKRCMRRCLAS